MILVSLLDIGIGLCVIGVGVILIAIGLLLLWLIIDDLFFTGGH
jgi:hypothetical protein